MSVTVLICDDQAMVRQGLKALVNTAGDLQVIGEAADGVEAVRECAGLHPDVVLMDVRMPEVDGLQAAATILSGPSPTRPKVLMLTTFDIDDYVYEALRIGAGGFLLKDAPMEELNRAIRVVAAGDALLAPSVTRRLIGQVMQRRSVVPRTSATAQLLTEREREVLVLVARGLSNAEIAVRLSVAEQTVKTHVSHVFTKLDLRDRAQAVVYAYENAIVGVGESA
ncbi:response regulator [Dermacoccaceae bacterium W4C1]